MAPTSVFRAGATALITGSANGVGFAVAKLCALHQMNLILVDNDGSKLNEVQSTLAASAKGQVESHAMDLDFLHLNAGIGLKGDWSDSAYFQKIFNVNFFGVMNGINTFVPHFEGNSGEQKAIVVTGSKQGITNPPGNPAYNASKSAIKTITEHLSFDLAKSSPSTSVHLLVPGWTFTGLTGGGSTMTKPEGAWSAEQVADYLYKKMGEGKFYVMCPDNDVSWETDRKRMMWTMGDIVYERQPQSRWRDEFKEEAANTMESMQLGDNQRK